MRLQLSFFASLAVLAALVPLAGIRAQAQSTASPTAGNGTYISVDPLANVRYDYRYDVSLGMAYGHIKAGPTLLHGANLGGLDLNGSYWYSKHWGVEGSGRGYLGTSGSAPNSINIKGPFVSQYMFVGGPEWLGPHNKHGAIIVHVMGGGSYGLFETDLHGNSPSLIAFYNNQIAPAAVFGGHIDLNRSARWVFRITPDALYTRYSINYGPQASYNNWNFGISVGVDYKFKKKR